MTDSPDFLPEIRAVVARYLDGDDDFDAAARALATILRRISPQQQKAAAELLEPSRSSPLRLKPLSLSEWMNPDAHRGPTVEAVVLAPGRSRADEARAVALMIEAARRASSEAGGDAA